MALSLNGVRLFGLTMSSDNVAPPAIGTFVQAFSSVTPPGAPIPVSGLTFQQVSPPPGPYEFSDPFGDEVGFPYLDTRLIDGIVGGTTVTIPANYPSGYTWIDTAGASDPVSGGSVTVINGASPLSYAATQEFNMPTGLFIEFIYDAPTLLSTAIMGINLGDTNLSIVVGPDGGIPPDGNGFYPSRVNAGGFNGYTGTGGGNYQDGLYSGIQLTGGSGGFATADITITGGSVVSVALVFGGDTYQSGDILSANYTDIGGTGADFGIFVDTVDFSGAITALGALTDGTPLTANPADMWDTASASFSTDAYYSDARMDWRGVLMRAELTPTTMTLLADGVVIVQQTLRFTPQLFASNAYKLGTSQHAWSSGTGSMSMFCSGVTDPVTFSLLAVGAL